MTDLRHRRGVLAVDRVDRLEEPKEHAHIHRVVRQGPIQGLATFIGLLIPLIAIHAIIWSDKASFWRCLPMAMRSLAGPFGEVLVYIFQHSSLVKGQERWFCYTIVSIFNFTSLSFLGAMAGDSIHLDIWSCNAYLILVGIVTGVFVSLVDSVWPKICYRLKWIESVSPPTPLFHSEENSWNPYAGMGHDQSSALVGHFYLVVRSINMILLIPLVEELFFREHIYSEFGHNWGVPLFASAFIWSCFKMHYKGEWFVRFFFGLALQVLVVMSPLSCGLVPSVAAHATRNLIATIITIKYRQWYRWDV